MASSRPVRNLDALRARSRLDLATWRPYTPGRGCNTPTTLDYALIAAAPTWPRPRSVPAPAERTRDLVSTLYPYAPFAHVGVAALVTLTDDNIDDIQVSQYCSMQ